MEQIKGEEGSANNELADDAFLDSFDAKENRIGWNNLLDCCRKELEDKYGKWG